MSKPKLKLKAGDVIEVITPLGGNTEWQGKVAIVHTKPRSGFSSPWFELLFPVPSWHMQEFHLGNTWRKHIRVLGHINV